MRIAMTTDTVGGVWTFTKELASDLLKRKCSIALVSLGRAPTQEQMAWAAAQEAQWGENFRFEWRDTPLEWMQENERALEDAAPVLTRILEEFDAQLLLSSQYCFGALECEIPRIVVAHSDVLSWADACRPDGLQQSAWLDRYCRLVSAGLNAADGVVAPTHWMMSALGDHFQLPRERRVIPNGRNLERKESRVERKMQAVVAGRLWDEAKNLRILEGVDSPMPMLIAGETAYESAELKSGGDAILLGRLNEGEMLELFRESAIYVCTSIYEPFGLAPLEAALCGCAVLVNDIPPLREVWGDAALYFSDSESLSEWLWRLNDHKGLLHESQAHAMNRAREFTVERMSESYMDLFREILREAREGAFLVERHVA